MCLERDCFMDFFGDCHHGQGSGWVDPEDWGEIEWYRTGVRGPRGRCSIKEGDGHMRKR